jgi:putative SOS response-associated peptidase YedK
MCGRYIVTTPSPLAERFALTEPLAFAPTYNGAPSDRLPVIVEQGGRRRLELMQWGLVPHWAKDPKIGARLINVRAETVAEKPAFRLPLCRQRCLVPTSGFYEWVATKQGKLPYYIHRKDGDLFAVAGLYDTWQDATGERLRSYTVITTEANSLLLPIHDRMPVILPREAEAIWLDPAVQDVGQPTALLRPYSADDLEAYPVSRRVNAVRQNDPSLLKRVAEHARKAS